MDYSKYKITSAKSMRESLDKITISGDEAIKIEFRKNIIEEIFFNIKELDKGNTWSFSDITLIKSNGDNMPIYYNKNGNVEVNEKNLKLLNEVISSITKDSYIIYTNMSFTFNSNLNINNIIDEELKQNLRKYLLERDIQLVERSIKKAFSKRNSKIEISKSKRTYFDDLVKFLTSQGYKVTIKDFSVIIEY